MKRTQYLLLLTILFCVTHISGLAQTVIYNYDPQGNVISRCVSTRIILNTEDGTSPVIKINKDDERISINISESKDEEETSVLIYDSSPRFIEKRTFTGSEYSIDLEPFPKGMYILEIEHAKEIYTEKFFKN